MSNLNIDNFEESVATPLKMAMVVIDSIVNDVIKAHCDESKYSEKDSDSGKDSINVSDSKDDDSVTDQSDLDDMFEDNTNNSTDDVCFMENWKMERQFDKAIEGLRKLKDEPVKLNKKSQPFVTNKPASEESFSDDNETFVISPFSENQTYTIKVSIFSCPINNEMHRVSQ